MLVVISMVVGGEEGGKGLVKSEELPGGPYTLSNDSFTFVVCSSGGGPLESELLPVNGSAYEYD